MHDSYFKLLFWQLEDILSVTKFILKVGVPVKPLQNDILQLFGTEPTSLEKHNPLNFSNNHRDRGAAVAPLPRQQHLDWLHTLTTGSATEGNPRSALAKPSAHAYGEGLQLGTDPAQQHRTNRGCQRPALACRETRAARDPGGRSKGAARALGRLHTWSPDRAGPGPGPPPQPPHLVLSTLGSKGQNRTTILFTGRSTTLILDAIFFPSSTTAPSSPRAGALDGGGRVGPPRGHMGTVVRAAAVGAGGPRVRSLRWAGRRPPAPV